MLQFVISGESQFIRLASWVRRSKGGLLRSRGWYFVNWVHASLDYSTYLLDQSLATPVTSS